MNTYTVILVRKDSSYESKFAVTQAFDADEAEKNCQKIGWCVVAVVAGEHAAL